MRKIAVIGIAGESVFLSVDDFGVTGETTVATSFYKELGGKGFNQAIASARYGAEVSFLGACYQEDKENFSQIAQERGVKPFFVGKKEGSSYAVITTDKQGNNKVCVYRGAELSVEDLECFAEEIKTADILLINNETPIAVNKRAVEIAKKNGIKVVLNPAPARRYEKDFLDKIDLFTPNEHETVGLEDYTNVIVTLGDKGCFIKGEQKYIPAEKVEKVVDTTGAGDTFNGILAACLANELDVEMSCEKATVAAAIKVGRKYVLNAIPVKDEIDCFKERS